MAALALAIGLGLIGTNTSPAQAQENCTFSFEAAAEACNDGDGTNGYWWYGFWVPGYPTFDSWFRHYPLRSYGNAVWYSPGIMEATAAWRALSLDGYLDGVATMTCGPIGHDVWLKRPDLYWEGPFLVVDCARRNDIYGTTIFRQEAIEVGYRTAERWGLNKVWRMENVEVLFVDPALVDVDSLPLVHFPSWWEAQVSFSDKIGNRPIYRSPSTWRIDGEWVTFEQFVVEPTVTPKPTVTLTPEPVLSKVEMPKGSGLSENLLVGDTVSAQEEEIVLADVSLFLQELTGDQISQLSVLVLVIAQVLKIVWYGLLKRPKLSKDQMRAFIFVLSVPVGFFFSSIELPTLDDPMAFAQEILALATQVLVISGLVYEYLLQGLLGFVDSKAFKKAVLAP